MESESGSESGSDPDTVSDLVSASEIWTGTLTPMHGALSAIAEPAILYDTKDCLET